MQPQVENCCSVEPLLNTPKVIAEALLTLENAISLLDGYKITILMFPLSCKYWLCYLPLKTNVRKLFSLGVPNFYLEKVNQRIT